MKKIFQSKIYVAVLLLLAVFIAGVFGYKFISEYSWIDAFYMTVITITTVGFGEVVPLDDVDKLFTSVLILSSIFILAYAISVITEYMLSKNNIGNLREKRIHKIIDSMKEFYLCEFDIGDIVRSGLVRSYIVQKYNTGLGDRE